jgi:hypothetical protein
VTNVARSPVFVSTCLWKALNSASNCIHAANSTLGLVWPSQDIPRQSEPAIAAVHALVAPPVGRSDPDLPANAD